MNPFSGTHPKHALPVEKGHDPRQNQTPVVGGVVRDALECNVLVRRPPDRAGRWSAT
jgi:hypothetical protein